jgi:hypothetical protein
MPGRLLIPVGVRDRLRKIKSCYACNWRALRESNPCFRRERAASWTARRRAQKGRGSRAATRATYKELWEERQGSLSRLRVANRPPRKPHAGCERQSKRKRGGRQSCAVKLRPPPSQARIGQGRRPRLYQCPVLGIEAHGSFGGCGPPFCSNSTDCLSGERTNAIIPSRGGRLMVTPAFISFSQTA